MEKFDISKIFYDKEPNKAILEFFEDMNWNPLYLFTKKKNYKYSNIDVEIFVEHFLCDIISDFSYLDIIANLKSQSLQRIFVLLSYVFFSKKAFNLFKSSNLNKCKGPISIEDDNTIEYTIILNLLKKSGAKTISEENNSFSIGFSHALCTPLFGTSLFYIIERRFAEIFKGQINEPDQVFDICYQAEFHKALGLEFSMFRDWLEGKNLGNYIKDVEISNFVCIENARMECNKSKEVYILGENGDGKTLLLEAIYMTFAGNNINNAKSEEAGIAKDLLQKQSRSSILLGNDALNNYGSNKDYFLPNLFAYGTHRGRVGSIDENDFEKLGFMTLFDSNKKLINPSAWIKEVDYRDLKNQESSSNVQNAQKSIQSVFDNLLDKKVDIIISNYEVKYIENGAQVSFEQLSEGYRTILIFVCDLLYRFYKYKMPNDFNGVFDAKGVVLIDEIDAHLHPRWQRTIVGRLRKLFPEVQFIMTTHSPHIIQGAGQDAVIFRVYRDGVTGKTCVSEPYLRNELNYMMINTLTTSPLFGLENARLKEDDETEDTSSTYIMNRIEKKVLSEIRNSEIKNFITNEMIDEIIDSVFNEEFAN